MTLTEEKPADQFQSDKGKRPGCRETCKISCPVCFARYASSAGWSTSIGHPNGDKKIIRVDCKRKDESLWIQWTGFTLKVCPEYSLGTRLVKLRNEAAAKRQLLEEPDYKLAARGARRHRTAANGSAGTDAPVLARSVPWPASAPDSQVLKACYAATLVWVNRLTGTVEMAHVNRKTATSWWNWNKQVYHISYSSSGRRILNFVSQDGGFRSVAIDEIIQVR